MALNIEEAAGAVLAGEVVAFPTDTVYGLMALPEAAERIYEVKRRPAEKRLVVMAASTAALEALVVVDARARDYMERYWPGPLTLVLRARTAGETFGVRIPDYGPALELLRAVGRPVVTTSANLSGAAPALTAVEAALNGVAGVVDAGPSPGGEPSTVLDLTGAQPVVLREGAIPTATLLANRG